MAAVLDELGVSEDKKRYILDHLNPLLDEMVSECIKITPPDPVTFMLDFLETKRIMEEDAELTAAEKARMLEENKELSVNLTKVTVQYQETAVSALQEADAQGEGAAKEEEEEEEDDEDEEPPEDFFKPQQTLQARSSVSAEAYGDWNRTKTFVPPVVAKNEEQKQRLRTCLCKSFMFASLEENDMNVIIGAMKEVKVEPRQRVINQGDPGDFLFVIESGALECIIERAGEEPKVVKTCREGDVFGELALLYNCPRAAHVESAEQCILWQLDRDTFNSIVRDAAQRKRNRYDAFLSQVPLLSAMDAYERSQLADALVVERFEDGQNIVAQGDDGSKFYIIEDGKAVATKGGQQVMSYSPGDYFGELALIRNQPRAATVTCAGSVSVLSVDRGSVYRLLNVSDLLERSKSRYD